MKEQIKQVGQIKEQECEHIIDARDMEFRELNEKIREFVKKGGSRIRLRNVVGHRYIGCGLIGKAEIIVDGVPGNDIACFMDGNRIVVNSNAQDGVANTMSSGEVVVHGDVGDVLGYAMRGGRVFVKGNAGYRIGIHMKAFRQRSPVVVIGGTAMDYFGEYMAGGTLIILGLGREEGVPLAGDFLGAGMHGGEIFINGEVSECQLGKEVGAVEINGEDRDRLGRHLSDFASEFGMDPGMFDPGKFTRLVPVSHRPYGKIYVY